MARETNFATVSTTSSATATLVSASLVALSGTCYQIVGFDGSSSDQPFAVALKFGSVTRFTMQGSADTTVGRDFGDSGPVAPASTAVTVEVTPAASGTCNTNLICRIVF